jgi:hypothetical protein
MPMEIGLSFEMPGPSWPRNELGHRVKQAHSINENSKRPRAAKTKDRCEKATASRAALRGY